MLCLLAAFASAGSLVSPGPSDRWHLELASSQAFKVDLTSRFEGKGVGADRMQIVLAVPPRTEEQPDVSFSATLTVNGREEALHPLIAKGPLGRNLLESRMRIDDRMLSRGIVVHQVVEGTAKRYRLVSGQGPQIGKPLSPEEREVYTASDEAHPWKSPGFQRLLGENGLKWDRSAEDAVAFARRAYRFTKEYFHYGKPKSENMLEVLQDRQGECGDISLTFNSILRANGIPARARVGRWIENGKGSEAAQSVHVRSEFYLDDVGWVPVDVTAAQGSSDRDEGNYFGYNGGVGFLTLHLDPDVTITEWGSQRSRALRWVQQVQMLLWGPQVDFGALRHRERYERIR